MDWVAEFFKDADKKEINALAAWFADTITARFGNGPTIEGKPAVVEAFGQFFSSIKGMRHVREHMVVEGDFACNEAIVTYTTLDNRDVSVPVASSLHRTADGKLDRLFIFIDLAPVFAPAA